MCCFCCLCSSSVEVDAMRISHGMLQYSSLAGGYGRGVMMMLECHSLLWCAVLCLHVETDSKWASCNVHQVVVCVVSRWICWNVKIVSHWLDYVDCGWLRRMRSRIRMSLNCLNWITFRVYSSERDGIIGCHEMLGGLVIVEDWEEMVTEFQREFLGVVYNRAVSVQLVWWTSL